MFENATQLRANILGGMDCYIREYIGDNREYIGDESIIEYWNIYGVPDNCDEDDLMDFAFDLKDFNEIVEAFNKCIHKV